MADAADVTTVKLHLPDELGDNWNDEQIGQVLDSGSSVAATVALYYSNRMANTSKYVDVSESGSSRSLSAIWQHYRDMYEMWQTRADGEVAVVEAKRRGVTFGKINRPIKATGEYPTGA